LYNKLIERPFELLGKRAMRNATWSLERSPWHVAYLQLIWGPVRMDEHRMPK
jgi:hypothetical protein